VHLGQRAKNEKESMGLILSFFFFFSFLFLKGDPFFFLKRKHWLEFETELQIVHVSIIKCPKPEGGKRVPTSACFSLLQV
jgi:hypothetical protein